MYGPIVDRTVNEILSAGEETHLDRNVKLQERKKYPDAEALGVCHRPGCAVPETGYAKALIGCRALARHVAVTGTDLRNDQVHPSNSDVTLNLATTLTGRYEKDLLDRPQEETLAKTIVVHSRRW